MTQRGRARIRVRWALLAVLGALLASPALAPQAHATVATYVYVADAPSGGQGGTIHLDLPWSDPQFDEIEPAVGAPGNVPPGTCGIRWHQPSHWSWAPDPGPLFPKLDPKNPPMEVQFTGPYPGCGGGSYNFGSLTTSSLNNPGAQPIGATHLMVEVQSLEDIEFLNKNGEVLIPDWEPKPDPEEEDICSVPEFCEPPEGMGAQPNPTHSGTGAPKMIINYPGAGASIPEGSALTLHGSSWAGAALPYFSAKWRVRHLASGLVLHSSYGHGGTVPAGVLITGPYTITFSGNPGGGGPIGSTSIGINVTDRAPRESPPFAVIKRPGHAQEYVVARGAPSVDVELAGMAGDAQDGPLDGTRLQWIAQSGKQRIVLCTGSRFAAATGTLGTYKSCSKATVAMKPPANAPISHTWMLELRSVDSTGSVSDPVTRRIIVRPAPVS